MTDLSFFPFGAPLQLFGNKRVVVDGARPRFLCSEIRAAAFLHQESITIIQKKRGFFLLNTIQLLEEEDRFKEAKNWVLKGNRVFGRINNRSQAKKYLRPSGRK